METKHANVFPIIYIKYRNDEELQKSLNILSSQLSVGTGNENYNDKTLPSGYGIKFSDMEDIRYPYQTDFDDFKQLVIQCVYGLSEEQIEKIVAQAKAARG